MPKFKVIAKTSLWTIESAEHEDAKAAASEIIDKLATIHDIARAAAVDLMLMLFLHGKLEQKLYKDGAEVDPDKYL